MKNKAILSVLLSAAIIIGGLTGCQKQEEDPYRRLGEYQYVPRYTALTEINGLDHVSVREGKAVFADYGVVGQRTPTREELENYPDAEWIHQQYGCQLWEMQLDGTGLTRLTGYQPIAAGTENSSLDGLCMAADGSIWVFESHSVYQEEEQDWERSMFLRRLDEQGNEQLSLELTDMLTASAAEQWEEGFYLNDLQLDDQGRVYLCGGQQTLILDDGGNLLHTLDTAEWVNDLIRLQDGRIGMVLYDNGYGVKVIDPQTGELTGEAMMLPGNVYTVYDGGGEYPFYCWDNSNLYGYNAETRTCDVLVNWIDSDILSEHIRGFGVMDDGRIGILSESYGRREERYSIVLTRTPSAEIAPRTILTYATLYLSPDISEEIIRFNRINQKYRIRAIDYSLGSTASDPQKAVTMLNNDIAAGNVPDLLNLSGLPMEIYAQKGLLADLLPYLEKDDVLSPDGMMPCYLHTAKSGDQLLFVTPSFSVVTVSGAKSVVGDRISWTWEEANALMAANPDKAMFSSSFSREEFMEFIAMSSLAEYVDWEKGECSFDRPDFLHLLAYAGTLPSAEEMGEEYVYDYDAIMAGRQLLNTDTLYSFSDLMVSEAVFGEETSWIGFPVSEGSGTFLQYDSLKLAISAQCKEPDAAWAFVRGFLTEEYQLSDSLFGFPTNRAAYEKRQAEELANVQFDEEGNPLSQYGMGWGEGTMMDVYPPLQEDYDRFSALLENVTRTTCYDETMFAIISEECSAYFGGVRSAEDAAGMINNRISTYINEQR